MDEIFRDQQRRCKAGENDACLRAFIALRRAGVSAKEMSPEILYGKTNYQLAHQTPLDFRNLLRRMEGAGGVSGGQFDFYALRFNDNVSISVQANRGVHCTPQENLADPRMYDTFEVLFESTYDRQTLEIPTHVLRAINSGAFLDEGSLVYLRSINKLREAKQNPLCHVQQDPSAWPDPEWTTFLIQTTNPDFFNGGVYYEFPHQKIFGSDGIAGNVPVSKIQEMVDFLRARFGLPGEL